MARAASGLTVDWFQLVVPGGPVPWARARRNGKRYFNTPEQEAHRERIRGAWIQAGRPYLGDSAIGISVQFYLPRPKTHLGTGRNALVVKPSAPLYPATKTGGDLDNLVKQLGDALQGYAFADDGQIVDQRDVLERYAQPGHAGCTVMSAWVLDADDSLPARAA